MRALFAATTAAVAVAMLAPGSAVASDQPRGDPEIASCLGLMCAESGTEAIVPEAQGPVPSVGGPEQLTLQTRAGFYEYGQGTTVGKRAVAYVVPYGQSESMPASIRNLPEVKALESGATNDFQLGTVVIFGPGISLLIPNPAAPTVRRQARRDIDAYNCYSQHLCLYYCWLWSTTGPCTRIQFNASYAGRGWYNLGDFAFNDATYSVRNRRDHDSLLARDNNGNGTPWCGQQHSVDTDLHDEPIGGRQASSVRLPQTASQC